jgi:hypothetical protein
MRLSAKLHGCQRVVEHQQIEREIIADDEAHPDLHGHCCRHGDPDRQPLRQKNPDDIDCGAPALALLVELRERSGAGPWVLPASRGEGHFVRL